MKQRKKQKEGTEETLEGMKNSGQVNETPEMVNNNVNGQEQSSKAEEEAKEWKAKYDEMNDKYLRLYSEFDNFRKRALKERIELSKTASEQVIADLLTVLDDFERAIASYGNVEAVEPIKEGTTLIFNKFKNNLTQKGLTEVDAMGKEFDTDYHEAIANVPATSDEQKNKVIDVTQKGYLLNGKVIRFAKVVVAK